MNRFKLSSLLAVLLATIAVLCVATLFIVFPARTQTNGRERGAFPDCQQECLYRHTHQIRNIEDDYANTHNKLTFQDEVEKAVAQYSSCIENCRQPYPVK
ncbi:MAG TPA: hypothetical protein VMT62_00450 [Syntrophorhabdaceae bacterium]|nr:hypothetical protein [Syntrophorhabdaceae bacterium]